MRHDDEKLFVGIKSKKYDYSFYTNDYEIFQWIYVIKGTLLLSVHKEDIHLKSGWVALLRQGGAFRLSCKREGYTGVFFTAEEPTAPEFQGAALGFRADPGMQNIAALLEREIHANQNRTREVLVKLGCAFAWQTTRYIQPTNAPRQPTEYAQHWVDCGRLALETTLETGRSARDVLSSLPLSYRQISRYFKEVTGLSPKQMQINLRLQAAERLLAAGNLSITAVAMELGYPSSQHFATQFQKWKGVPPSTFRGK